LKILCRTKKIFFYYERTTTLTIYFSFRRPHYILLYIYMNESHHIFVCSSITLRPKSIFILPITYPLEFNTGNIKLHWHGGWMGWYVYAFFQLGIEKLWNWCQMCSDCRLLVRQQYWYWLLSAIHYKPGRILRG